MNTTATTAFCGDPIFNVIVTFGTYVVSLGGIVGVLAVVLFAMISGAISLAIYQWIHGIGAFCRAQKQINNEDSKYQEISAAVGYAPPGYHQCA